MAKKRTKKKKREIGEKMVPRYGGPIRRVTRAKSKK